MRMGSGHVTGAKDFELATPRSIDVIEVLCRSGHRERGAILPLNCRDRKCGVDLEIESAGQLNRSREVLPLDRSHT